MAARGGSENDTARKQLLESTQKIVEAFRAGQVEVAQSAFSSFRQGINHVSSGRTRCADSILDELGPKDVIVRFLVDFYTQRRIFRKQIASVVTELMQIDSWLNAVRVHLDTFGDLPGDLVTLLVEREDEKQEHDAKEPLLAEPEPLEEAEADVEEPRRSLTESGPSREADVGKRVVPFSDPWQSLAETRVKSMMEKAAESTDTQLPIRATGPTVSGSARAVQFEDRKKSRASTLGAHDGFDSTLDILEEGCQMIRDLGFHAADTDAASCAFETFRRGVIRVSSTSISTQDSDIIERMEPKANILEFLVDMYERHQKFRSRVTKTLNRLLPFDGWRAAADENQSVQRVLNNFEDMQAVNIVSSVGTFLNVNTVAATAVSHGGIGALYVQIIAGYNLVAADANGTSDPYVKVTLGKKTQRTPVICDTLNPAWNATPFLFEAPSLDEVISFEVLDSDFFKDDPLGDFEVSVSEVPIDAELSLVRRVLGNVPHGELELKLLLVLGKELDHVPQPWQSAPAGSDFMEHADSSHQTLRAKLGRNPKRMVEDQRSNAPAHAQEEQSTIPWTPWGPPPTASPPTTTPPTSARARAQTNSNNPFGPEPEGEPVHTLKNRFSSEGNIYISQSDHPISPKFPSNPFSSKKKASDADSVSAPVTPRKSSNPFPSDRDVSPRTPHRFGYQASGACRDPQGTTPNVSPRSAWPPKAPPAVARPTNPFSQCTRSSFPVAKARNPFSAPYV